MDQPVSPLVHPAEKYQLCQQHSSCYLLLPPPRPPTFPKLALTNSSTSGTPIDQSSHVLSVLFGVSMIFTATCFILCLVGIRLQLYYKLRCPSRRASDLHTNDTGIVNPYPSFSSILPTSYDRLTPSTITTNVHHSYLSLAATSKLLVNPPAHHSDDPTACYYEHASNIYEEIRSSHDHPPCACCSCTLAHYQQKQSVPTSHSLTPYYYTCDSSASSIVCQACLSGTLQRKHPRCSHNFFVPIK